MSGTRISSTFDGRWVKTIVLIRPIRAAIRAADERRHRGQQVRAEEDRAEDRRLDAVPEVEPVGHQALRDEPATEGVDREEQPTAERRRRCERPSPRRRRIPSSARRPRRRLDGRAEPPEADGHDEPISA